MTVEPSDGARQQSGKAYLDPGERYTMASYRLARSTLELLVTRPDSHVVNQHDLGSVFVATRACGRFMCTVFELDRSSKAAPPNARVRLDGEAAAVTVPLQQTGVGAGGLRFATKP